MGMTFMLTVKNEKGSEGKALQKLPRHFRKHDDTNPIEGGKYFKIFT